jgi:integrase
MSRVVGRLNARTVATAKLPKDKKAKKNKTKHVLADGGNLFLEITQGAEGLCKSWLFQYQLHHRRRFMGLGPIHTVSLGEARAKARLLRQQLIEGVDPLEAKRERTRAAIAAAAKSVTFEQCAASYINLHGDGWSTKHHEQWEASLRKYVLGKIGRLAPADIDSAIVMKVIEPIWTTRTVTASRILDRIGMVWDFAKTSGYCSGDNPARAIRTALPKQGKITKVEHFPAMPFDRIPTFMAAVRADNSTTARALELLILTASRTSEVRLAKWSEIDFAGRKWNRPASRMKGNEDHVVPLSDRAVALLRSLPPGNPEDRIFPISEHGIERVLKKHRPADVEAVAHGFRSTFRQWTAERTSFPDHVAEQALAHRIPEAVVRAYKRRAEVFDRRRRLMDEWSRYCSAKPAPAVAVAGSNVVALGAGA